MSSHGPFCSMTAGRCCLVFWLSRLLIAAVWFSGYQDMNDRRYVYHEVLLGEDDFGDMDYDLLDVGFESKTPELSGGSCNASDVELFARKEFLDDPGSFGVSQLRPGFVGAVVFVKVLRVWTTAFHSSDKRLNLVLCDDKGVKICGTVYAGDYDRFSSVLCEGVWVTVRKIVVIDLNSDYRITSHRSEMLILGLTVVDTQVHPFDRFFFFVSFEQILDRAPSDRSLVGELKLPKKDTGGYAMFAFELRDLSNVCIKCEMFGGDARKFYNDSSSCSSDVVVLVARWAIVDVYAGKVPISTTYPTMIMVKPRFAEVSRFRSMVSKKRSRSKIENKHVNS